MTGTEEDTLPPISWVQMYRLRLKRRRLLWRSFRSRRQLSCLANRTRRIGRNDILAFTTLRNEITRLPWFLHHYRALGVDHFLIVDNDSDDGSVAYLDDQPDVSLWQTRDSYRASRYGLDWLTWLQMRYGHDHWCLMVDADELLIYPDHDTRSLRDLTHWLDAQGRTAFGALMLDLYPKGPLGATATILKLTRPRFLAWFDAGPYRAQRQSPLGNLWVQGGARERMFFGNAPRHGLRRLNKIPLGALVAALRICELVPFRLTAPPERRLRRSEQPGAFRRFAAHQVPARSRGQIEDRETAPTALSRPGSVCGLLRQNQPAPRDVDCRLGVLHRLERSAAAGPDGNNQLGKSQVGLTVFKVVASKDGKMA